MVTAEEIGNEIVIYEIKNEIEISNKKINEIANEISKKAFANPYSYISITRNEDGVAIFFKQNLRDNLKK